MRPVDQTKFVGSVPSDDPDAAGNCMQAAFASLLELPLEDVPHFAALGKDDWWPATCAWVLEHGFCMAVSEAPMQALGIMSGRSPRGSFDHVVVALGDEVVHDPHPSRDGVIDPCEWWYLVPVDPVRAR